MKIVTLGTWLFLTSCFLPTLRAAEPETSMSLHSGDVVVFYGDSITDQRLYTSVAELFMDLRYPKLNIKFVHSGWGGDRVSGGGGGPIDVRLDRDVLAYKPTVMTIMLGMNDGKYVNHTAADDETYYKGYQYIVDKMKKQAPGIRITAIEPSPFDDATRPANPQPPGGYNTVMVKYSDWIKQYASQAGLSVADFNAPMVAMLKQAASTDPKIAQEIIPDRVHPTLAGHLIMAEQLLKSWHVRPIVSSVSIDAAGGKMAQADFAQVTDVKSGDHLTWMETDEALPLPMAQMLAGDRDGKLGLAIKSSDVTEALNQQPLKVTGLKSGRWTLAIDGQPVGSWSNDELAHGINLAVLKTPMAKQASDVKEIVDRRIEIHNFRWRTLQVPLADKGVQNLDEAMRDLDSIDTQVEQQVREAAQPKPHTYELMPAT